MSLIIDITLECDTPRCFKSETFDHWDLDQSGDLDELPDGWTSPDDGDTHLCPACSRAAASAPTGQPSPGVCREPRPGTTIWVRHAGAAHTCELPAGHPGPHECHRNCMTWGCAA